MAVDMANAIRSYLECQTVSEALSVMGTNFEGLQIDMGKAEDDIFFVDPPFAQLAEYAARYGEDFELFIEDIERAKEQLVYVPPVDDVDENVTPDTIWKRPIHLMTALRAKGKEFDTVVLLDVNDGIWPNRNAREPAQKESERRVFYVAFTRAKRKVIMLVAKRFGNRPATPSQYIEELGLSI
jgi:DNA helicase-2/ATP-dependent DNA helicase PcrA